MQISPILIVVFTALLINTLLSIPVYNYAKRHNPNSQLILIISITCGCLWGLLFTIVLIGKTKKQLL